MMHRLEKKFYNLYKEIKNHQKFVEIPQIGSNGVDYIIFQAIFRTGEFKDALYDYNAGILLITVYSNSELGMSISTIDDGVWQATCKKPLSVYKARELCEDIESTFDGCLDTEKELNDLLNNYGLHGLYTG